MVILMNLLNTKSLTNLVILVNIVNLMTRADKKNSGKIHIKTLSSFKAFGSGSYRMTSVKKLKGTGDFLAMSSVDKKCSLEDYEECRRRSLFESCQCVPWELGYIQVLKM